MNIAEIINGMYLNITLSEMRTLSGDEKYPKVTYNSVMYLFLISSIDKCTVSELARLLHVTKSAVTIKVNELIEADLIKKVQSEGDRRINYITVSERTEREFKHYNEAIERAMTRLENSFSAEEISAFATVLAAFGDFLKQETEEVN